MTRAAVLILALLAALAGACWAGYAWRDGSADAELAELKRQHQQAVTDAVAQAVAAERRVNFTIKEAQDDEFLRRTAAESAAARAAGALVGLRHELAATRAHVKAIDWRLASSREAAAATVAMLTQLLGECGERRAEVARFADQAASAGRLCQRAHDAVALELK